MATPTNLPAAFTVGQVATAAQMNDLRGAFRVLQVIQANTFTQAITTSATYATTNLAGTITPQATSSKVLVITTSPLLASGSPANVGIQLVRGGTVLQTNSLANYFGTDQGTTSNLFFLDAPSSTSALTYTLRFNRNGGSGTVYAQLSNQAFGTMILMEISA